MKIAADTNVLVRFIMNDDVKQARMARAELEGAELVAIASPALCELVWVLSRGYHSDAIHIKAQTLLAQQNTFELYKVFEEIAANEPERVSAWMNLGKLQLQLRDPKSALKSFERANELAPLNQQIEGAIEQAQRQLAAEAP